MASSAALTTTHLPALRAALDEWREQQSLAMTFTVPAEDIPTKLSKGSTGVHKDVIVGFRTRPPLEHEAEDKFKAYEGKEDGPQEDESAEHGPAKFCPGITASKAEPGEFVAHVPGLKVRLCHSVTVSRH